eukprot:scaffold32057_cov71-Phaeocystis_antarctica.AAC.3
MTLGADSAPPGVSQQVWLFCGCPACSQAPETAAACPSGVSSAHLFGAGQSPQRPSRDRSRLRPGELSCALGTQADAVLGALPVPRRRDFGRPVGLGLAVLLLVCAVGMYRLLVCTSFRAFVRF